MRDRVPIPPVDELARRFFYDPEDGMLYRKLRVSGASQGAQAGYIDKRGYWRLKIGRQEYLLHRVIWKMHHDTEPDTLDHIDRNPSNNQIENLREVTQSQNVLNVSDERYVGTSNYRGVHKVKNRWVSAITRNKKKTHLGYFLTEQEARNAYMKAAENVW